MKKALLSLIAVILIVVMMPVTAVAHGGHGGRRHGGKADSSTAASRFQACSIGSCDVFGPHLHDDSWYCNQDGINWDDYVACPMDGCAELGAHEHDGQWYHCSSYPTSKVYRKNARGCCRS